MTRALSDDDSARARSLAALKRAREDMEHWGQYADQYFRDKHDLAADLAAIDVALASEGKTE